jgi:hypothetical protein
LVGGFVPFIDFGSMKVSPEKPFQIIYSLFSHEFLGLLFESFVVQLDEKGRLSFAHQNISHVNAPEFASGLDDTDFKLIKWMDDMQQEAIVKNLTPKSLNQKNSSEKSTTQRQKTKLYRN